MARCLEGGQMVSSALKIWQGGAEKEGRFVVNLARHSKHWSRGSVKMDTVTAFAMDLQKGDMMMSWDVKSGYRHFYLHPSMREMFVFFLR